MRGIYPEHPSLNDTGIPPPPKRWKWLCVDAGPDFNSSHCNKKLIGAQVFLKGAGVTESPRDGNGHGTHTATTAAGRFMAGSEFMGLAKGTAAGMAPHAHIAVYKVCFSGCVDSDILARIDQAIKDGVDVLSISLSSPSGNIYSDTIAIGAFRAMENGIFVSSSAGNKGPMMTLDRELRSDTQLGNGEIFVGKYLFQPKSLRPVPLPLQASVAGKAVLCEGDAVLGVLMGDSVLKAGGAAMILVNPETDAFQVLPEVDVLPVSKVIFYYGTRIKAYINSTRHLKAAIPFKGTVLGEAVAPVVARFSWRGPNPYDPRILKPDIVGPGVSILAGWNFPTGVPASYRREIFNFLSGTSMSAPHLSAIAAPLKAAHPDWSPAAIKSAMMTTADVLDNKEKPIRDYTLKPASVFAMGAGHVNPRKATNPGLVYDI
ncbi:hypothetical protein AMTRI_Chr09g14010 [Amborella trichopoda]